MAAMAMVVEDGRVQGAPPQVPLGPLEIRNASPAPLPELVIIGGP